LLDLVDVLAESATEEIYISRLRSLHFLKEPRQNAANAGDFIRVLKRDVLQVTHEKLQARKKFIDLLILLFFRHGEESLITFVVLQIKLLVHLGD